MAHPVKGIDHCYILVNNLEESAAAYRRLGFTLSPRGLHSRHKGTGNYTIMFPHDYLELLGIIHVAEGNIKQRERLANQGQGLHAIASRIDNAEQAKKDLLELGFATENVNSFSRPITLPDGNEGIAAFDTVFYKDSEVPQGLLFMCQHKTPEMVWRPELLKHANGAIGLAAITAVSSTPLQTAENYARLYAHGQVFQSDSVYAVETGPQSAQIWVCDKATMEKRFPQYDLGLTPSDAYTSISLRVEDLYKTKQVLNHGNIDWQETERGTVTVSPEFCNGTILEFVKRDYLNL